MKFLFLFFYTLSAFATPEQIEVVFLSHKQINALLQRIDSGFEKSPSQFAQASKENCIPMGEGCFHPQFGMIPYDEKEQKKRRQEPEPEAKVEVKTIGDIDTDSIKCEKGSFFDVYCGKFEKKKRSPTYEVWIDTSSSFKNVDYSKEMKHCERRYFVSKIRDLCGDKVMFSTFDSMLLALGSDQNLCQYAGMNNKDQLIQAIKNSTAKYLLIVTDVEEYTDEFRIYVDSIGAQLRGVDATSIYANQLSDIYSSKFKSLCK